jgi:hypothetical protein
MFGALTLERVTFNKISLSDKINRLCVDLISFDFPVCPIHSLGQSLFTWLLNSNENYG